MLRGVKKIDPPFGELRRAKVLTKWDRFCIFVESFARGGIGNRKKWLLVPQKLAVGTLCKLVIMI